MTILTRSTLLGRLGAGPEGQRTIFRHQLRQLVQSYVAGGLKASSLQRRLQRENVDLKGLGFAGIAREAEAIYANQNAIQGRSGNLIPRPGRDMLPARFKVPANYRYIVKVNYVDPSDPTLTASNFRSVHSLDLLTKAGAEARGFALAQQGLQSPRGGTDPFAPMEVESVELINAYHNEGIA